MVSLGAHDYPGVGGVCDRVVGVVFLCRVSEAAIWELRWSGRQARRLDSQPSERAVRQDNRIGVCYGFCRLSGAVLESTGPPKGL